MSFRRESIFISCSELSKAIKLNQTELILKRKLSLNITYFVFNYNYNFN